MNYLCPKFAVLSPTKRLMPVTTKFRLGFWGDKPPAAHVRCDDLFHKSMPFGKSKPPLPTRSLRSLRAAVRSTSSALCLHHAHPFVAAAEKRPVSSVMDSNDFSPCIFCTQSLQCLLDPSNSCRRHSEVLTRLFGLWSPKKRFGLWHFSGRRPQPRSNEEFQPFSCPTRSLRSRLHQPCIMVA